ncbi:hypothetical protein CHUAL_002887 [Chamberlinius hualienensis]
MSMLSEFAHPLRIKDIHFFNANYMVTLFWKIVQTFLPTKIKKRIHVHSSDWSCNFIPAIQTDILPNELGGKGGSMENLTGMKYIVSMIHLTGCSKHKIAFFFQL